MARLSSFCRFTPSFPENVSGFAHFARRVVFAIQAAFNACAASARFFAQEMNIEARFAQDAHSMLFNVAVW